LRKQVWFKGRKTGYPKSALIDSGADVTLVDSKTAQDLDLQFTGHVIKLKGLLGGESVAYEAIATIFIPDANVTLNSKVYVPDTPIDGVIIGKDILEAAKLRMEYDGQRLSSEASKPYILPQQIAAPPSNGVQSSPGTALGGLIIGGLVIVGLASIISWLLDD
jgi:hypothetical protein